MASSSYYKAKYEAQKDKIDDYKDVLSELKAINRHFDNDVPKDISNVNKMIGNLIEDLKSAIRHNSTFTAAADTLDSKKEKTVNCDSNMNSAQEAIEDEIARISQLKENAEDLKDHYYQKYKEARAREREAARRKKEAEAAAAAAAASSSSKSSSSS